MGIVSPPVYLRDSARAFSEMEAESAGFTVRLTLNIVQSQSRICALVRRFFGSSWIGTQEWIALGGSQPGLLRLTSPGA